MSNLKKALLVLGTAMGLAGCLGLAACDESASGHTHSYGDWTQVSQPTCTEPGLKQRTCTAKGCPDEVQTEEIPALGHVYVTEEDPAAECGKAGTRHVTCSRCDYEDFETIPALEHDYRPVDFKAAGCETQSVTTLECILCGDTKEEKGDPAGHKISNPGVLEAPTCTKTGKYTGKCSVCKTEFTADDPCIVPAKGHTLSSFDKSIVKAASCTETGLVSGTCATCGEEATEVLPITEHDWKTEYTLDVVPTYTAKGSKSIHCKNCTTIKDVAEVAVLPSGTETEHEFRLVNKAGALLTSNCTAAIVDEDGNTTQASFTNGKCKVSLLPGNYTVNLVGLPKGYSTEAYTVKEGEVICDFLIGLSVMEGKAPANTMYGVGSVMYDFTVEDTDGVTYKLSEVVKEYRLVVLNFWFINCGWCEVEFPYMEQAYKDYKDEVLILAITIMPSDSASMVRSYKESHKLTFPMVTYQNSDRLPDLFLAQSAPITVLISPDGVVLNRHEGALQSKAQFTSMFDKYMASAPASSNLAAQGEKILSGTEYLTDRELEI